MAETTTVHIGENSPEEVAFKMMRLIADVEGREHYSHGEHPMTREWILKTYEQCLGVIQRSGAERVLANYQPDSFAKHR